VGLPDPSTILSEFMLQPAGSAEVFSPGAPATTYRVLRTNQMDRYDAPPPLAAAALDTAAPAAALNTRKLEETEGHHFRGKARKAAKISISNAPTEVFADLADLIESLPAEADMIDHHPPIGTGLTSRRVPEEHRNVRVRAFLYAASREDDNDFHLIVGRDPNASPLVCMTVELSGTPPEGSRHFAKLKAAREAFKAFFAANPGDLPGFRYDFYDPPIPVEVEGSLFFDIQHAAGSRPGPDDLRLFLPVIWEVHPIAKFVLEP